MTDFPDIDPVTIQQTLTPEIYERFRDAIAIGRWPNGVALTEAQQNTCLQAIIIYENTHIAPEDRTGYVPPKSTPCDSEHEEAEKPLSWK